MVDPYGNATHAWAGRHMATPLHVDRRLPLHRRGGSVGFIPQGLGLSRPSGSVGLALPASLSLRTSASLVQRRGRGSGLTLSMRGAFAQYGGFGQRREAREPASFAALLNRRYSLVEATAQDAPIHRANMNAAVRGISVPATSAPALPASADEPSADDVRIDVRTEEGLDTALSRFRREAWTLFREGAYRPAGRLFELVGTLDRSDFESRLAELFCHVAMDSVRTSFVVVEQLDRYEDNVFAHEVDLTDRFASPSDARALRLRAQQGAQANRQSPQAVARHVLVLWYLGERREALLAARSAESLADAKYADWPAKMQAALNRAGGGPQRTSSGRR